jgi:hypothetical protein
MVQTHPSCPVFHWKKVNNAVVPDENENRVVAEDLSHA